MGTIKLFLYRIKRSIRLFFINNSLEEKNIFHKKLFQLNEKFHDGYFSQNEKYQYRDCVCCNNSENLQFVFKSPAKFDFLQCPNCEMVIMNPIPSQSILDKMYNSEEMIDNLHGSHISGGVIPKQLEDLNFIKKHIISGSLLDIGSGAGGFLLNANKYFKSQGLEINKNHYKVALEAGLNVHNLYSSKFFPKNKFEIVTLLQVIEHLENPKDVIKDAHRLLDDQGYLYIACPNFNSASMKIFREKHRHVATFGHINMYSLENLAIQIEQEGFKLIEMETYELDIELHDLFYYYLFKNRFSHRMSNYNPFTYQLFTSVFSIVRSFYHKKVIENNQGSYIRAIFKKKS
tara:strand:- start:498 stop:1535 length:1038 start_codon:yes stop_codon:yes gene_type:complete